MRRTHVLLFGVAAMLGLMVGNGVSQVALITVGATLIGHAGLTAYNATNSTSFIQSVGYLGAGALTLVSVVFPELSGSMLPGFALAVTPVVGEGSVTSTQSEGNDDIFVRDVDNMVHMIGADDHPLTTMKHELGKKRKTKKASSHQVEWYEDDYYDRKDTISANNISAAGLGTHIVSVTDPSKWVAGNIVSIPGVNVTNYDTDDSNIDDLRLYVKSVDYDSATGNMTVMVQNDTALPALTNGEEVFRLTVGASELQAQMQSQHKDPNQRKNYVQRFMGQVEISELKELVKTYTGDDRQREIKKRVYDLRGSIENADMFGISDFQTATDNSKTFYQGGIEQFAGQFITYTKGNLTHANLITWLRKIFARNNGTRKRIMFLDDLLYEDILNVPFISKQLEAKSSKVVWGVDCEEITGPFGTLYLKHHKGIAETGRSYYGQVVDLGNVWDRPLRGWKKEKLLLKESGQKNVKADLLTMYKSLEVVNAPAHAVIQGLDA